MAILMLYNENEELSFDAIQRASGISSTVDLKRHLLSLCTRKAPVLIKDSKVKGITENDSFSFNKAYQSKQMHVRIPMIALKEVAGAEDSESLSADNGEKKTISAVVEKDRCILVEASIVRIMKTRKTMLHHELVAEVVRRPWQISLSLVIKSASRLCWKVLGQDAEDASVIFTGLSV